MTEEVARYPVEVLGGSEDDGTMVESLEEFSKAVVGHRIVATRKGTLRDREHPEFYWRNQTGLALLLDTGQIVWMAEQGDCCAFTTVDEIVEHLPSIEHVITGVGTTDGYQSWHIYADLGDVMELKVDWSCGNPFYYAYGFNITVYDATDMPEIANQFKEITDGNS